MDFVFFLRDTYGLSHKRFKETFFELFELEGYRSVYTQGTRIVGAVDPLQMLIHDKSLQYLNLAVKPCFHYNCSQVKFEIYRNLPLACGEYFLAESEIPPTSTLGRAFRDVELFQQLRIKKYTHNHFTLGKQWFRKYMRIFFQRFEVLDGIQRRTAMRRLMNTYRILQIQTFSPSGYQSMIRECTSSEADPVLTIELLRTLCINSRTKIRSFLEAPNERLETMLCHAKVMQFDFWGLWRAIGEMSGTFNPVAEFIIQGKNQGARILLKYGFPYSCEVMNSENTFPRPCGHRLKRVFRRFMSRRMFLKLKRTFRQSRLMLIMITFMAFDDLDETGEISADSIPTLVCLMRCVPEPYVHPIEMCCLLEPFFLPLFHKDLERIALGYMTANIYVGEDHTILKPRKLEHLCRCAIRRAMAKNLRLPEGIKELEVSSILKDILLLKF